MQGHGVLCRYKPDTVDTVARETQFSKEEVKCLYRAFKQECPTGEKGIGVYFMIFTCASTGISDEETFKEVYQKIFPLGDSSKYAGLVFRSIDQDNTGTVTFGDFMDFLSMLTKGSVEEKILWSFHFYDVNKDGFISKEEMVRVGNNFSFHLNPLCVATRQLWPSASCTA